MNLTTVHIAGLRVVTTGEQRCVRCQRDLKPLTGTVVLAGSFVLIRPDGSHSTRLEADARFQDSERKCYPGIPQARRSAARCHNPEVYSASGFRLGRES